MNCRMTNAPCGYLTVTSQGLIKDVNQTLLTMLGYEQDDLLHQHMESLLTSASKMVFHSLFFLQLQLKGQIEEIYVTLKGKNREEIPVLMLGNKVTDDTDAMIDCMVVKMAKRNEYEKELRQVKKELERAYKKENELRSLFETTLFSINEGIIVTDKEGKITLMNRMAEIFTGWPQASVIGQAFADIFLTYHRQTREKKPVIIDDMVCVGCQGSIDDVILVSRDGTERFIMGTVANMVAKDGGITGVVISFRDITKEYLQAKEIDGFLNVNLDMLCVTDLAANFHKVNKKFEEILGYKTEELVGESYLSFIHEEDIPGTLDAMKALTNQNALSGFTNRYRCKDGSYKYIEWHSQPGVGGFIYSSARDVTEKKQKEEQLLKIAVRDQLTGLYNRHYFNMILGEEMEKADRYQQPLTLAILDLDHFKYVNDTWGHPIGDELLKLTAATAKKQLRGADLLIRFGGEEFVVLMPQTSTQGAIKALEKIRLAIENTDHPVTGKRTVSIGVAERATTEAFRDWYQRADEALYRAKQKGRNRVVAYELGKSK
ncbi:sensor domain-containing diguanylate cyclase [Heliophilum fasciatum]|uniref:PAS domain S-box-containing protein/diguanylate cyclase (GGDEF)-like protein n=1 Tax=Heliophilum fasciatum TaxID=35700 RepID=A0A4R2RXA3_9FIRM|nr:diguanylate cyclase [Heliophilum fasciatum]MCW2277241.1 diguanylate cyclase (GGDEF)-like protein/PAS domain S-box-containing protein [Heliophilum fasciatum]TCP68124.1 PAS domain S-box-containing protein/diguanylate cyclase (GGDEF)-like protein [Heliophilum fasciatum]